MHVSAEMHVPTCVCVDVCVHSCTCSRVCTCMSTGAQRCMCVQTSGETCVYTRMCTGARSNSCMWWHDVYTCACIIELVRLENSSKIIKPILLPNTSMFSMTCVYRCVLAQLYVQARHAHVYMCGQMCT